MFTVDTKIIEFVFYETPTDCITGKFMQDQRQSCKYTGRFFEARMCSDDLQRGCTATSINKDSEIESKNLAT
jgi:hypothetical protein